MTYYKEGWRNMIMKTVAADAEVNPDNSDSNNLSPH